MAQEALLLDFLLKTPPTAAPGAKETNKAAPVDAAKMQASFADLSIGVLTCYHRTAHYRTADKVQQPWQRQSQYAADNSAVVRIGYTGVSGSAYEMDVAVMVRDNKVQTAVVRDTAVIPYSRKCQLENRTGAPTSSPIDAKKASEKK